MTVRYREPTNFADNRLPITFQEPIVAAEGGSTIKMNARPRPQRQSGVNNATCGGGDVSQRPPASQIAVSSLPPVCYLAAMTKVCLRSVLVAVALLAFAVIAEAQQPKKIPRIGYLSTGDPASESARAKAIRVALSERGYIEGQNIAIEYRYAEGKLDRLPALAAELVLLKVDIILVSGASSIIRAAKNATKTIPIVMGGLGVDPVEAGFIESLARPGGNVTGITNLSRKLGGKRLELLKEAVPKLGRVAVLYDSRAPAMSIELKEVQTAARALRVTVQPWGVEGTDDFEQGIRCANQAAPAWTLRDLGSANVC